MHIHWLQHAAFEGLGSIEAWAEKNAHTLQATRFWAGDPLPDPASIEMLVVMGGPMGVYDESTYPWLTDEKRFIREAADSGIPVLGLCLGAQLLAAVYGARISANPHKEIGWFGVVPGQALPDWAAAVFPQPQVMFHWHGDTFALPEQAAALASSDACRNQGFVLHDRIVGLQFHPEMTAAGVAALIENCAGELVEAPWIQTAEQMRDGYRYIKPAQAAMERLLDYLSMQAEKRA